MSNECGGTTALPSGLQHGELASSQAKLRGSPGRMVASVSSEFRTKMAGDCFVTNRAIFGHFWSFLLPTKKLKRVMLLCLAEDFTQNLQHLQKLDKF